MPKLTGVFEDLANLETLPVEEINKFLTEKVHIYDLENFLGNRILYPQTVPFSKRDMDIDLAILCAYMSLHQDLFFMVGLNRIVIPEKIELRFPPLANLVFFFPEIFKLRQVVELGIKKDSGQIVIAGSIISPNFDSKSSLTELKINGEVVKLDPHGMTYFESEKNINELEFSGQNLIVAGGSVGIVINQKSPPTLEKGEKR